MLESNYDTVDNESLKKKKLSLIDPIKPIGAVEGKPNLPSTESILPIAKQASLTTPTSGTSAESESSFLDKAKQLGGQYGTPIMEAGLNIFQRENSEAQSEGESTMAGLNTTVTLAKTGMALAGPAGAVGLGGIGAIYSSIKSRKDKKARQARDNKIYNAALEKTSADRDRDNLMMEAKSAVENEKKITQIQMGLMGNY